MKSTTFFGISILYWKKNKCFRGRKSRSVLRDSAVCTRREHAEDEWDSTAPVVGRSSFFVEVFQHPHHKRSLIIQIQNSASLMFSANVLRCLTDGEKWTAGKMLVPGCSDSSKARAAVLGPGSRTINYLCQTWCSLARQLYSSGGWWPKLPGGPSSSQGISRKEQLYWHSSKRSPGIRTRTSTRRNICEILP